MFGFIMMQKVLPQLHEIMTSTEFLVGNPVTNAATNAGNDVYLHHTAPRTHPVELYFSFRITRCKQANKIAFFFFFCDKRKRHPDCFLLFSFSLLLLLCSPALSAVIVSLTLNPLTEEMVL